MAIWIFWIHGYLAKILLLHRNIRTFDYQVLLFGVPIAACGTIYLQYQFGNQRESSYWFLSHWLVILIHTASMYELLNQAYSGTSIYIFHRASIDWRIEFPVNFKRTKQHQLQVHSWFQCSWSTWMQMLMTEDQSSCLILKRIFNGCE